MPFLRASRPIDGSSQARRSNRRCCRGTYVVLRALVALEAIFRVHREATVREDGIAGEAPCVCWRRTLGRSQLVPLGSEGLTRHGVKASGSASALERGQQERLSLVALRRTSRHRPAAPSRMAPTSDHEFDAVAPAVAVAMVVQPARSAMPRTEPLRPVTFLPSQCSVGQC